MEEFLKIFLLCANTALGLYLALFKSYFQERGKNLATKEDIGEITKIVEDVKHSFTKETEQLRSSLSLFNNVFAGLVGEERNAIVDLNEKYFLWLHCLMDSNMGGADIKVNKDLDEHKKIINDCWTNYINSRAKFDLFVDDIEFKLQLNEMEQKTMELFTMLKMNYIHSLIRINLEYTELRRIFDSGNISEAEIKRDLLYEKSLALSNKFGDDITEAYKIILKLNSAFHRSCRQHLYKLIENKK
ncbi:hypothetical protein [Flavobacterium sp.]|uniref:hypothetical protein n=1 Tax=Flavobacterium sp. TaxID=239 RepID=UPI002C401D24|nr:hypothetical protein [Flavobacterium sp.]HSD07911.1 hypothetical protein [Flavobacterium sp.]